ncbi:MAG: hypothetical protein U9P50_02795 [Patescibacteria group bacterium]|nr:hypothetical protein [Patescibacteria group bacterium]
MHKYSCKKKDVYVSSDGYVTIRLVTSSYWGYLIDLHQFGSYGTRDIYVTDVAYSSTAEYY